jgi:ribosomal protein L11 methyltransferase
MKFMHESITYEISLTYKRELFGKREIILCLLETIGIERTNIVEFEEKGRVRISFFSADKEKITAIKKEIIRFGLKGVRLNVVSLKDIEWQTKWKTRYKPFFITKKLRIIPFEKRETVSKKRTQDIFIDTSTVFGTGTHPTTRFLAEYLEMKKGKYQSTLDIGTGTGILTIIAKQCGANIFWALDISKKAITIARKNFGLNNVKPDHLEAVDFRSFYTKRQFDFVLANVITEELVTMQKKIIRMVKPGKYLAVSGISLVHFKEFRQRFETEELRCVRIKKKDGWTALLYKKIR